MLRKLWKLGEYESKRFTVSSCNLPRRHPARRHTTSFYVYVTCILTFKGDEGYRVVGVLLAANIDLYTFLRLVH